MFSIELSALAEVDIEDAFAYYASISPELRQAFDDKLTAALALLCEMPGIGSRRFAYLFPDFELRTWTLDRFPFRIFYAVQASSLIVLRIDHVLRDVRPDLLDRNS